MVRQREFKAQLKTGQLAPDITDTEAGREFVHILAKGTLKYCSKHGIEIPTTLEEFETRLADRARREGVDGGIAFEDLSAFGELLEFFELPMAHEAAQLGQQLFSYTSQMDEVNAKRIDIFRFIGSNTYFMSLQEKGHWIREWGGQKMEGVAKAFEYEDCQRRLVFKEMRRIVDGT